MEDRVGMKSDDIGIPKPGGGRKRYEKPQVTRIDLALEETLSDGCKMASDVGCVGPPITTFAGGS